MRETYRINMTEGADADLVGIFNYIATDSPEMAAKVVDEIMDEIDKLYVMPSRFRLVARTRDEKLPVHKLVVPPYLVYYSVQSEPPAVFVLSILHGKRRQPRRFD